MTKLMLSWILLAFAFTMLAFGLYGIIEAARSEPAIPCVSIKDRDQIRVLTLQALDEAFKLHVIHLYEIWLRDFSPEPQRAKVGMTNSISAYQRARAMQWDPPICQE